MVLQQQAEARLWGNASPGSKVTVTPSWGDAVSVQAGKDGSWTASVKTPAGSFNPETIVFSDDNGGRIEVGNVLIGEVWLASGQSNMEMPLKGFGGCCVQNGIDDAINAI